MPIATRARHRLLKVQSAADSGAVTIQTAEFDAMGRRIQKVVTNSGNLDATTVYLYNGHKIIETRDGSNNVVAQFIHGRRYIDIGELVMARIAGKGNFYYQQDANWNVIALTDLGGSVLERYDYTAYGEMTVHQETSFGDRDGDQDVDATDKGTVGVTCTGTVSGACRVLDLDFDGDYDATDATAFDALAQGLSRHPGRTLTGVAQPFGHQGLLYEPEIGSYQNRARQFTPTTRRFMQRDPLAYIDGLNFYAFEQNNSLRFVDPSGTSLAEHLACHAACAALCWWSGLAAIPCHAACFILCDAVPIALDPGEGEGDDDDEEDSPEVEPDLEEICNGYADDTMLRCMMETGGDEEHCSEDASDCFAECMDGPPPHESCY